ncbi:Uma2 family endonuclease [Streptomyces rubellomurinus]|uniref:Membrane protein n=1 Tax=Streptomyces rubellomurinus (strain ATCC 31215) TaxID=359131 RepID=A0A0F2TF44_STRR3|nr:Uma2 family endonuclease [Streptomyces rubellomurinus]KJS61136.1 membrane protein [Streptomyces rubellomurinus]
MSAAAVEEPSEQMTLLEAAELVSDRLVGHRVEILGGQITVTPPPDGPHGEMLTDLMIPLWAAGLHGDSSRVVQGMGLWLPGGPSDYAIPDLCVVDADYREHLIERNCYDPVVFRLVVEVTSSNFTTDLKVKPPLYAEAGVPGYVIVDRTNQRVMVLTDPKDGEYRVHAVHHPGQSFTLPESIGASVTLKVDDVLAAKK